MKSPVSLFPMYKNLLDANIMHVSFSDGITYDIDLSVKFSEVWNDCYEDPGDPCYKELESEVISTVRFCFLRSGCIALEVI